MRRIVAALIAPAMICSCGGDSTTSPPGPPPVASVELVPSSGSLFPGQTLQFSAVTRDAAGATLSGRTITWSSSNQTVATVSGGLVSAVAVGTSTISAVCEGRSASASLVVQAPTVTLLINNQLLADVIITVNDVPIGTAAAQSTTQFTRTVGGSLIVGFLLVRPTTTLGVPVGEQMSGVFAPVSSPSGSLTFTINNVIGGQAYFAPLISNLGLSRLLMAVNFGLIAENRCNCTVSPGQSNVFIGYYRLFTNSNVRAYRDGLAYTGQFVFWDNFFSSVTGGSGSLPIFTNLSPRLSPLINSNAVLSPQPQGWASPNSHPLLLQKPGGLALETWNADIAR